jgi:hypothetical protein
VWARCQQCLLGREGVGGAVIRLALSGAISTCCVASSHSHALLPPCAHQDAPVPPCRSVGGLEAAGRQGCSRGRAVCVGIFLQPAVPAAPNHRLSGHPGWEAHVSVPFQAVVYHELNFMYWHDEGSAAISRMCLSFSLGKSRLEITSFASVSSLPPLSAGDPCAPFWPHWVAASPGGTHNTHRRI